MKYTVEHLGLPAPDSAALKNWYVDVLEAKLVCDNGQTPATYLLSLAGGLMIEIYPATTTSPDTANNFVAGFRHLALRVASIEEAQAALEKKGVTFPEPSRPAMGGGRVLFFRDPNQNLLHFVERAPDSPIRA
ncbi:MAG TPA: VOC family protein [Verrucomicrobiae bacterium]|jgi:glyoxylase I family protein|nr:VOC family protein [Verrucomicrobiae bacterium]